MKKIIHGSKSLSSKIIISSSHTHSISTEFHRNGKHNEKEKKKLFFMTTDVRFSNAFPSFNVFFRTKNLFMPFVVEIMENLLKRI